MKSRAICTAIVVPGAVTARVDRVIRPTREARALLAEAERLGSERCPAGHRIADNVIVTATGRACGRCRAGAPASRNPGRNGPCDPHRASVGRPFRVIGISIYLDDLNALDRLVTQRKRAGQSTASRSGVIREAVKALMPAGEQ